MNIIKCVVAGFSVPFLVIPIGMVITGFNFNGESFFWYGLGLISAALDVIIISKITK